MPMRGQLLANRLRQLAGRPLQACPYHTVYGIYYGASRGRTSIESNAASSCAAKRDEFFLVAPYPNSAATTRSGRRRLDGAGS